MKVERRWQVENVGCWMRPKTRWNTGEKKWQGGKWQVGNKKKCRGSDADKNEVARKISCHFATSENTMNWLEYRGLIEINEVASCKLMSGILDADKNGWNSGIQKGGKKVASWKCRGSDVDKNKVASWKCRESDFWPDMKNSEVRRYKPLMNR